MPPKAPVMPGEKAAAKRLQNKVEKASLCSVEAVLPSEVENLKSSGRPIRQAKEVAMKNQVWAADKPATRKRAASSIANSGKGKQKKLTVGSSIKNQIVPPEKSVARPPRLRKQDIDLHSLDQQSVDTPIPEQLKDLFYDETPHFVTNTNAALKPVPRDKNLKHAMNYSSKRSSSYATSMVPTSDSDDDHDTVSGSAAFSDATGTQTTKAVAIKTEFNLLQQRMSPLPIKGPNEPAHKAALEHHQPRAVADSLAGSTTEVTWSLLTHLVWNGNNMINLLSQQAHIQVILHAAIQLVE
ncbi:hypothetical protein EDD22DRAFT_958242 [Suillus occidentalis]|nr:hypothetical protein EDD22DRAFT_958242 [Suillus occidentalis]